MVLSKTAPRGVLFDMDGVIIDSESYNYALDRDAFSLQGFTLDWDTFGHVIGTNEASIRSFYESRYGKAFDFDQLRRDTDRLFFDYIEKNGVSPKPGALAALRWLKEQGFRLCLATSNDYGDARFLMERIGVWELFDAVVTGDRVGPSKPAPDIYLAAAAALGLAPEECLAVEDSYAGVKSAAAARCQTVMVPDLLPPTDEMHALADAIIPSLEALPAYVSAL